MTEQNRAVHTMGPRLLDTKVHLARANEEQEAKREQVTAARNTLKIGKGMCNAGQETCEMTTESGNKDISSILTEQFQWTNEM